MNNEYIKLANDNQISLAFAEAVFNKEALECRSAYGSMATDAVINNSAHFRICGMIKNNNYEL